MAFHAEALQARLTELIRRTTCVLPEASLNALEEAYAREADGSIAKVHLETNLRNQQLSRERLIPLCADTGIPCFFVRIGAMAGLDLAALERCLVGAVVLATRGGFIRPTVVDPLSRSNPGSNVGPGSPVIKYRVDPELDCCEITYAPKGGGTEIFGPAFRTILASDGIKGIKKFVVRQHHRGRQQDRGHLRSQHRGRGHRLHHGQLACPWPSRRPACARSAAATPIRACATWKTN